jgi:ribonuclease HII
MNFSHLRFERRLWANGVSLVAGVDEAGRGPLAGPVVAAAVIMPRENLIRQVNDSKVLPQSEREELYTRIRESATAVGIGVVDHLVIDRLNILNASFLAMCQAVEQLSPRPEHLLIDGNRFQQPRMESAAIPFTLLVDGDARCYSIAAASIIAKVTRDRIMEEYDLRYPGYGFVRHKGYATPEHREAIFRLGYCEIHRRSFSIRTQLEFQFADTGGPPKSTWSQPSFSGKSTESDAMPAQDTP